MNIVKILFNALISRGTRKKFKGLVGTGMIDGVKVMLLKPTTYMNRSGESVIEALNFYKLDPQLQMVVV